MTILGVQLIWPWHKPKATCKCSNHCALPIVKIDPEIFPAVAVKVIEQEPRARFIQRCVIHHVPLHVVRETQKAPLGLWCPRDGGHGIERRWEMHDTVTGRSMLCDAPDDDELDRE